MEIKVNGEAMVLQDGKHRLLELLAQIGIAADQPGIAVAVNMELVPRSAWTDVLIAPHDEIEVITARQGG